MDTILKIIFEVAIVGGLGYNLRKWIGETEHKYLLGPVARWIWRHVIKSEREAALNLHHVNRALNRQHQHKSPLDCKDGRCVIL